MKKEAFLEDAKKKTRPAWARMFILLALLLAAGLLLWQKTPQRRSGSARPAATGDLPTVAATLEGPAATPAAEPAPAGRTARELAYDKDIQALRELIGRENVAQEVRDQAGEQLARMVANHHTELGVEEALQQAGFPSCQVVLQNDAITVTMGGRELTATESAAILAVCVAHSDIAAENIRMMAGGA